MNEVLKSRRRAMAKKKIECLIALMKEEERIQGLIREAKCEVESKMEKMSNLEMDSLYQEYKESLKERTVFPFKYCYKENDNCPKCSGESSREGPCAADISCTSCQLQWWMCYLHERLVVVPKGTMYPGTADWADDYDALECKCTQ